MFANIRLHLAAIVVYALLVLAMSWPLPYYINSYLAGSGGDPYQTVWRFTVKAQELLSAANSHQLLGYFKYEFLGAGEPRLVNLSAWPWLWLQLIFTPPTVYNIVWLASYVLSGYAMFLLIRYLITNIDSPVSSTTAAFGAPFLGGLAYMFLPYHVAHSFGHFGAMQTQWLPLIILFMFKFLQRPFWSNAFALSALLVIQAWTEHHYLLWWFIFSLFFVFFYWRQIFRLLKNISSYPALALIIFISFFFIILPYRPTMQLALPADSDLKLGLNAATNYSADIFSYFVPAFFHPLFGKTSQWLFSRHFTGNLLETTTFLGFIPLMLTIYFHASIPKKQKYFWFTVAIFFCLLSLGPFPHFIGFIIPWPLPFLGLSYLPVFDIIRAVSRASVLVNISWIVLFGWVLSRNLYRRANLFVVGFLLLLEFLFYPFPLQSSHLSSVYGLIESHPGQSIIELPAATDYNTASRSLLGSTIHHKNVIGNIALERAQTKELSSAARSWPAIRQLLYLGSDHLLSGRQEFFKQDMAETFGDVVKWQGISDVIVHPDELSLTQQQGIAHFLTDTLSLDRQVIDGTWLYSLAHLPAGDSVFLARDENWQNVFYDQKLKQDRAEIKTSAKIYLYNISRETKVAHLTWQIPSRTEPSLAFVTDARYFTDWHQEKRVVKLDVVLPAGVTPLTINNTALTPAIFVNPRMQVLTTQSNENTDI